MKKYLNSKNSYYNSSYFLGNIIVKLSVNFNDGIKLVRRISYGGGWIIYIVLFNNLYL